MNDKLVSMKMTIGVTEAKARFSELLDCVERGESIVISRNGVPIAEVRPVRHRAPEDIASAVRAIAARTARRNEGKEPWPPAGRTFREIAHERHRG